MHRRYCFQRMLIGVFFFAVFISQSNTEDPCYEELLSSGIETQIPRPPTRLDTRWAPGSHRPSEGGHETNFDTRITSTGSENGGAHIATGDPNFRRKRSPGADTYETRLAVRRAGRFLRLHKFADFDRRFDRGEEDNDDSDEKKTNPEDRRFVGNFPRPVLRTMHPDVVKQCKKGVYDCLQYIDDIASQNLVVLRMKQDQDRDMLKYAERIVKENLKGGTNMDKEAKAEFESSYPLVDYLDLFKWRVTASYYMCWYTINKAPVLKRFYASCGSEQKDEHDYRGEDSADFMCAKFVFCPDPCCSDVTASGYIKDGAQCKRSLQNPCRMVHDGSCGMDLDMNNNYEDFISNRFNVTCNCDEERRGFVWNTQYRMCVDRDECYEGAHECGQHQVCRNTVGDYMCTCRNGYVPDPRDKAICHRSTGAEGINVDSPVLNTRPKMKNISRQEKKEENGIAAILETIGSYISAGQSSFKTSKLQPFILVLTHIIYRALASSIL